MTSATTRTVVAAALTLTLVGCSTAPKTTAPPPAPAPMAAAPAPAAKPAPAPVMAPAPQPKYVIEGVQFDLDSASLKPEAKATLDNAAAALRKQPGVMYTISGYTDTSGSEAHNMQLSEQRAQSVQDYLVSKGVDAKQLSAKGFGQSMPLVSNNTREGRMKNRRVEIWPVK